VTIWSLETFTTRLLLQLCCCASYCFFVLCSGLLIQSNQHGGQPHLCWPPPHASSTWAHHPYPSATWARHLHPHRGADNWLKKVWKQGFEPKTFKVGYIPLSTKGHFHLCLYSVFSVFILINIIHYQFSQHGGRPHPRHVGLPPHASSTWEHHHHLCESMGLNPRPSRLHTNSLPPSCTFICVSI
jgi:hypothetical protein